MAFTTCSPTVVGFPERDRGSVSIRYSRDWSSTGRRAIHLPGRSRFIPIKSRFIPRLAYNTPLTDRVLYPYVNMVQVYDTQTADGVEWNMIGHGEWVEARIMATVTPNTTPPEGVTNGRWIDVDLAEQTLAVYDNNQLGVCHSHRHRSRTLLDTSRVVPDLPEKGNRDDAQ